MLVFENAVLNSHLLEFPFSWHFACFSNWDSGFYFFQEIVPHFVYLLNPFLSVFPCKRVKSCFFQELLPSSEKVAEIPICSNSHFQRTLLVFCFGTIFPFARIPICSKMYCIGQGLYRSHRLHSGQKWMENVFSSLKGPPAVHSGL